VDLVHTTNVTPKVDRAGRSPLFYAALEGRAADVAAYLQEHGDEVNSADKDGFTPLHFAAQQQHADVAALLIEAGADLNARNKFGNTPLSGALFNVRDRDGEVIHVLLDAGADPDVENNYGVSPRGLATKVANYDLMRFFRD
jgi:ankyrin repeat protein